ncbi:hypothetical protein [Fulvivirga sediminis]|uniref:Prenyltransferase n=1 Tax=Fulvivirga sediminis TaxID=2803949 RepID=A0A937FC42_9BACT|nr:hypothetical protein [Fulvivirga sediminis]MBL3657738.1 hypothetical protein [Fulvivirga sediminis]
MHMKRLVLLYEYFNLLSLDVAFGAVSCALFVAEVLGVNLPWCIVLILGLTVWLIYTFDHLVDARGLKHMAGTRRHRFHQKHYKVLTFLCASILIANSVLVFYLPKETVILGVTIGCLVMVYFLLLHFLKLKPVYHKELMIAVLYSAGVMVGPVSLYKGVLDMQVAVIFIQFVMIALSNLVIFSLYEKNSDIRDSFPSIVQHVDERKLTIMLKSFLIFQLVLAAFIALFSSLRNFEYTLICMLLVLSSLCFFKSNLFLNEKYRWVGDAVFLLPFVTILYGL